MASSDVVQRIAREGRWRAAGRGKSGGRQERFAWAGGAACGPVAVGL